MSCPLCGHEEMKVYALKHSEINIPGYNFTRQELEEFLDLARDFDGFVTKWQHNTIEQLFEAMKESKRKELGK